ncbi:NAD-dependent epimerase [Merismopedia glauca]|uniref:Capsular biosynthesis protein CpsI n=1 Tax=Merismopedia glauca CCAP 1448/3 TaxID=1296344 RepID=A0A2T1C4I1_9CYAN|nr:NAD-dependent epimerase [Merismopedia glauca]PSB03047.1 capsular biosynthesis protein CpsI [Merismopedia glauca CCAP 1448/3]
MKILVTGAAGFIGFHVSKYLLDRGDEVIGIDNLNDYYDVQLKRDRLSILFQQSTFKFCQIDLADRDEIQQLFADLKLDKIVHLAAQVGVRYSLQNPYAYLNSNLVGFMHILEGCRHFKPEHLVFASSSSVYGANAKMPFSVHDTVDHPISFYAATKKANELMAHSYSHLYQIPVTGLRFFTVYGPWGRPDMATFLFTKAIFEDRPIDVFNYGKMKRDFTYVDDIVAGVVKVLDNPAKVNPNWSGLDPDPATSMAPYRIYNIGNNQSVELGKFIEVLEQAIGKEAKKNFLPLQPGDVLETYADINDLAKAVDFKPQVPIEIGIPKFVDWYREYYGVEEKRRSL